MARAARHSTVCTIQWESAGFMQCRIEPAGVEVRPIMAGKALALRATGDELVVVWIGVTLLTCNSIPTREHRLPAQSKLRIVCVDWYRAIESFVTFAAFLHVVWMYQCKPGSGVVFGCHLRCSTEKRTQRRVMTTCAGFT